MTSHRIWQVAFATLAPVLIPVDNFGQAAWDLSTTPTEHHKLAKHSERPGGDVCSTAVARSTEQSIESEARRAG